MQIYGPAQIHGAQPVNAPHIQRSGQAAPPQATSAASDQLDISPAADIASRLGEIPDVRHDRVAELRSAIADGTYDTEARLEAALDRLLDEIG
jgi:negative regulator of flagellin synthesis FlgM